VLPIASIHVPVANPIGPKNFDIGTANGVWGWTDNVWTSTKARSTIGDLILGQPVILALGGPNPRRGAWNAAMTPFHKVAVGTIVKTAYESSVPVWPDGIYPHRIGISFHATCNDVALIDVGAENWEAIRHSGCVSGAPYVTNTAWEIPRFAEVVRDLAGKSADGPSSESALTSLDQATALPGDYEFDREISATARVEARYMRRQLFADATSFECALCGRILPVEFLVTAHIKKRSECDDEEKGDKFVVMSNCLFGCDALYERGYVTVDQNGLVQPGAGTPGPGQKLLAELIQSTSTAIGSPCSAFGAKTKDYFAWHYAKYGTGGG
jgi:hypothetical protein